MKRTTALTVHRRRDRNGARTAGIYMTEGERKRLQGVWGEFVLVVQHVVVSGARRALQRIHPKNVVSVEHSSVAK